MLEQHRLIRPLLGCFDQHDRRSRRELLHEIEVRAGEDNLNGNSESDMVTLYLVPTLAECSCKSPFSLTSQSQTRVSQRACQQDVCAVRA